MSNTSNILATELLSDDQLAPILNVSVGFLRKDRRTKRRLPFIRLGDRILYDLDRVRAALLELEEGGAPVQGRKAGRATVAA